MRFLHGRESRQRDKVEREWWVIKSFSLIKKRCTRREVREREREREKERESNDDHENLFLPQSNKHDG